MPQPTHTISSLSTASGAIHIYASLLGQVFGPAATLRFSPAYLRWQYADNPLGPALGFDAWAGPDLIAAHYACIPQLYSLAGRPTKALLSLNTATAPAYQGQGLFTRLALATYQAAADQGYEFVIGVANASSTPGFLRRLGFAQIAPLEALVGIGSVEVPIREGTHRIFALDDSNGKDLLPHRLASPFGHYLQAGSGRLISPLAGGLGYMQLRATLPAGIDTQPLAIVHSPISSYIGLAHGRRLKGFWAPIPARIRPSPLNLIWLSLKAGIPTPTPEDLIFEGLDFDAY